MALTHAQEVSAPTGSVGAAPSSTVESPTVESPTLQTLNDRIAALEASLEEREQLTPTIGSDRATMKVFGRIHLDAWDFADSDPAINVFENDDPAIDPQNNIEFRRARIGVSGKIEDSMRYKIELEFGHPDEFAFKDLLFGFDGLPGGQRIEIGNQKRPYGLDHLNSSRYNVFIERPFVIEAMNQDARRLGIASYGLSEDQAWNWRYGVFHQRDWSKSGEIVGDTFQPELAGRLANTALWDNDGRKYAHWAVSGTVAFPDGDPAPGDGVNEGRFRTRPEARSQSRWLDTGRIAGIDDYQLAAAEGVWNSGPTQVVAEVMNTWAHRDDAQELHFSGGYVQIARFLSDGYMPWNRRTGQLGRPDFATNLAPGVGWGSWQIAARYSVADFSNHDIRGGRGESLTLGLNWYWNRNGSMQFNYIRGEISERDESVGGMSFSDGDYEIFGVRMRVDF